MNETVGPGTDNSSQPPAHPPARVAITASEVPRRFLSIALGISTIVLTIVGVFAVLVLEGPDSSQAAEPVTRATPEPTMRDCWDGSRRMSDRACPAISGQEAMTEWLVRTEVPFDSCARWEGQRSAEEIEVYDCLWANQGVDVFISRWDSSSAAQVYFADGGRSVQVDPLLNDTGGRGATVWVNDTAAYPFRAVLYLDPELTYSVNVVAQTTELRDAAVDRLILREPAELTRQGADR